MTDFVQDDGTKLPIELASIVIQPGLSIDQKHTLVCEWYNATVNQQWNFPPDVVSELMWDWLHSTSKGDTKKYLKRKGKGIETVPDFEPSDPRLPEITSDFD